MAKQPKYVSDVERDRQRAKDEERMTLRTSRDGDTRTVSVVAVSRINHHGTLYEPGTTFAMRWLDVDSMVAKGHVTLAP